MINFYKKNAIKIFIVYVVIFSATLMLNYIVFHNGFGVKNKIEEAFKAYNKNKKETGYDRFITPYHR
ncbi:hypothetical protein [Photorhabdus viridis]|uniref:hypothetical protein n=1 Tax=Photorhabdus viridis TaxID=3163327 RepID=UPI0033075195